MTTKRVAIVIGGASGIGWASAQALAADGCRIVVADRDAEGASARAAQLGAPHTSGYVDVTDEDSVQKLFADVTAAGPVDIVLNCAGFSNMGLITDMPVDDFRAVIDVCLNGGFVVAKHAGRNLPEGGVLVSISSLNGRQPAAGMSAYCAAKAGLSMLTQVAALELGPRGIRVNAIAPGFVKTPLTDPAAMIPGVVEDYIENTALGRAGTPEDIAAAVVFLCSPQSSWLTGEVLDLNGGAHLKRYPDVLGHVMKLAQA
ncbi:MULTISPECIES: SDR family NAD(P)-dependent oxidoreductase [unclassified Mycolicibacterium]|nr:MULTISPECIES: SDR family NAD(P)-dependent oxidoreductase [unclassified Mycolicibacterium]MUL85123.1 SDR family oxidoreductase [Mycolicibacterium sp. CBMA 329]MUL91090.1 SDR family oxidoreductase [Mycolicibacterium sp. CBMA 331]MUL98239.1 SDR family oxidoreductase [Mycolicibacterium sp. CBMA 334]MUM26118.1 SDR family oxidoreductase [Mycolicibacterium sp. CBMA 295]MUM40849.1 SDR family oxidoreductase [Mycolicibacterium sp. CBMA 247]